jgi:hypothetical protein
MTEKWITPREIELLQQAQEVYMPQTLIIRRRTYFGDGEFETVNIATGVAARVTPGYGFWRTVADKFQGITPFTITVSSVVGVQAGDQVVDEDSRVFEVRDVRAPSSFQTAKQVLCDLVTDG